MFLFVTVTAHGFKVAPAQRDLRVVDVLRVDVNLVMDDDCRMIQPLFQAPFAQSSDTLQVREPRRLPALGLVKTLGKVLNGVPPVWNKKAQAEVWADKVGA